MIQDKEVAKEISDLMLSCGAKLNASVALVRDRCSDEEFEAYRKVVSIIMGEMLIGIMNPLYDQHPNLKPKELL